MSAAMTREEIMSVTYRIPKREGDREQHLRSVVRYPAVPPQIAFGGPLDVADLESRLRHRETWKEDPQEICEPFYGDTPEEIEAALQRYWEGLEKAIPMAKAGWKIYSFDLFLAVLVRPE